MPTTESRIERLAEAVLEAHEVHSLPVDPLDLARREGIRLLPGDYDGCFDARIEHRSRAGANRFYLFYGNETDDRPFERVRFSLAHELGHFYLPEHRQFLLTGEWLGKRRDFLRARRVEREANWFAAALLMPRTQFIEEVQQRTSGTSCSLEDLQWLAKEVFQTSLASTALRYVQLNFDACCVVVSERGQLCYCVPSDALRNDGSWLVATERTVSDHEYGTISKLTGNSSFGLANAAKVHEETSLIPNSEKTLTFLRLETP